MKLLYIGDIELGSEYARIARTILPMLAETWDIGILATDGSGDPLEIPFPIWPERAGVSRAAQLARKLEVDVVLVARPAWLAADYQYLGVMPPLVLLTALPSSAAVNPELFRLLDGFDAAIVPGKTTREAFERNGWRHPIFEAHPAPLAPEISETRAECRALAGLPLDGAIVGVLEANDPPNDPATAALGAVMADAVRHAFVLNPTGPVADVPSLLASHHLPAGRCAIPSSPAGRPTAAGLARIRRAMDVEVRIGVGDGFNLELLNGLSSGTPQIVVPQTCTDDFAEMVYAVDIQGAAVSYGPNGTNFMLPRPSAAAIARAVQDVIEHPYCSRISGREWINFAHAVDDALREVLEQASRRAA